MNIQANSETPVKKDEKVAASLGPLLTPPIQNLSLSVNGAVAEKELKPTASSSPTPFITGSNQVSASCQQSSSTAPSIPGSNQVSAHSEKQKAAASSLSASFIPSNLSARFSSSDADTTFQSADNILYYVHRKNLECAATGFPNVKTNSDDRITIHMTEESDILDLLFDFIYPRPTPNVKDLPFETLTKLANAAEGYKVYSAMTICNIYMGVNVEQHPISVLRYAARYHYIELLDTAAPIAVQVQLDLVVSMLPPEVAVSWVYYYQRWRDAMTKLTNPQTRPSSCTCTAWPSICLAILDRIGGRVESFFDLDKIFATPTTGCLKCLSNVGVWRKLADKLCANIPNFSKFLFPKFFTTNLGVGHKKARASKPPPARHTSTTSAGVENNQTYSSKPEFSKHTPATSMAQGLFKSLEINHSDQARVTMPPATYPDGGHVQARASTSESISSRSKEWT